MTVAQKQNLLTSQPLCDMLAACGTHISGQDLLQQYRSWLLDTQDDLESHTHWIPGYSFALFGNGGGWGLLGNTGGSFQTTPYGSTETRPRNVALLACMKL